MAKSKMGAWNGIKVKQKDIDNNIKWLLKQLKGTKDHTETAYLLGGDTFLYADIDTDDDTIRVMECTVRKVGYFPKD